MTNTQIEEQIRQRKFLEAFVETQDLHEAAGIAQMSIDKARRVLTRLGNEYKILFAKIGLTTEDVLLELKKMILNPEEVGVTRDGIKIYRKNKKVQLKAIELYLNATGALKSTVDVNMKVETQVDAAKERAVVEKLKATPDYKLLRERALGVIKEINQNS